MGGEEKEGDVRGRVASRLLGDGRPSSVSTYIVKALLISLDNCCYSV